MGEQIVVTLYGSALKDRSCRSPLWSPGCKRSHASPPLSTAALLSRSKCLDAIAHPSFPSFRANTFPSQAGHDGVSTVWKPGARCSVLPVSCRETGREKGLP